MPSFVRSVATFILSIAPLLPHAALHAQARPAAAEVIAKYVAAIGGKAEIVKLTSMRQSGVMDIVNMGVSGNMEMQAAVPNKLLLKISVPNMMEQLQGFDGAVGWDYSPQQGARLLADKELAERKEDADFQGEMLYPADRYTSMETVGDTTIGTEKAWKLKLVRKASGKESLEYFSASTGLLLLTVKPDGISQNLEYKKFGAIMVPTKIAMQQGPMKIVMNVKDVEINSVPGAAFALPEPIKQLIKP